jgi:hypothetical protein
MYYFQYEQGNWHTGKEIHLPDNTKLTDKNKLTKNGWTWHETTPAEYLEYIKSQNEKQ